MSWLDQIFLAKRGPDQIQPAPTVPMVFSFSTNDTRPSWAGGTALYRTLDGKDLSALRGMSTPSSILASAGGPLPKRTPSWLTRQGDEVGVGDLVALSLLNFPDATGRIVGATNDGRIECVLGDRDDPHAPRPHLYVEADNLVMLLRKVRGGGDATAF